MEFIKKVGVELEGGWNEPFPDDDPTEIYADHSVHLGGYTHIGECASIPLTLEEVLKWTSLHYPIGRDETCGMHVHVSVKDDSAYASLASTPHFNMAWLKWGLGFIKNIPSERDMSAFYNRLSGKNRFCVMKFIPSRQIPITKKTGGNTVDVNPRYTQLNFAKGVHGTIENRTFPIFLEKETALSAIKGFVEMTEEFLLKRKEKTSSFKVVL